MPRRQGSVRSDNLWPAVPKIVTEFPWQDQRLAHR